MTDKKNVIQEKSFAFALRIIRLYKYLQNQHKEFVLSRQILRSGTSIGANVREAQNAESIADFIHKLGIAQKEADETMYWLELLEKSDYLKEDEVQSIHTDCNELLKILRSIIITTRQKQQQATNS